MTNDMGKSNIFKDFCTEDNKVKIFYERSNS